MTKVSVKSIVIEVGKKKIELSVQDAETLFDQLHLLFGKEIQTHYWPTVIYREKTEWPYWTYPGGGWSAALPNYDNQEAGAPKVWCCADQEKLPK